MLIKNTSLTTQAPHTDYVLADDQFYALVFSHASINMAGRTWHEASNSGKLDKPRVVLVHQQHIAKTVLEDFNVNPQQYTITKY